MTNKYLFYILLFATYAGSSCHSNQDDWTDLVRGAKHGRKAVAENPESFSTRGDTLVCSGQPGQIIFQSLKPFKNFELVAEVKTSRASFAALLFHTGNPREEKAKSGYKVVINNSQLSLDESKKAMRTGSLAGIRNIYFPMAGNDEWFTVSVKVTENHIETFVNGIKVVDYIQPDDPWRSEAIKNAVVGSGNFGIETQSGETRFRSLKVRPLPAAENVAISTDGAWDEKVTRLMDRGFPLIDFHVHLKGGLTIQEAIANSQQLGINYGIAPNCGLRFPVTDDKSLAAYMDTVRGMPVFRGMQAEGREWVTMFSPEAVAKFDYVFTDALTYTDNKGRRTRMWIKEEVWIGDKQQFMDQLTGKIEAIFSQEPVDIYVNPTVLPDALMPEYDQLWTQQRIQRVIKVLADNHIALEINARYKLPRPAFIKIAKEAGIKFSFGTNNGGAELGQLEYSLQMIDECGLSPEDMFLPRIHEQKAVLVKGLPAKITG